ncbi:MAG: peptide ABC transporter substrate-binding protein [Opitutaceae bacterium]
MRFLDRQTLATSAATALLLLTPGCGKRETTVEAGNRLQILHLGNGAELVDIDPHAVTGKTEHNVITALTEGLVSEDPIDLHPVPGVATHWEVSPDGLTYTFHLRDNARWSNGDPVTAHDFVRSWQRMLTPSMGSEYAYMLYVAEGAEAFHRGDTADFSTVGFREIDPLTVEIKLAQPIPYFLNLLNHYSWYPVHIPTVEKFGGLDRKGSHWTRPGNFVGNGPFVITKWIPNQVVEVEKSETYWDRDKVRLNAIHFHPVDSGETEERMFRSGQLHKTNGIPLSKVDVYKRDYPELLRIDPFLGTMYIRANVTRDKLADPRVRKALALTINREHLTTYVNKTGKIPAYNLTPPNTGGYTATARFEGTADDARRLLAEAGFPGGKGLPRIEMLYPTSENGKVIAEAIQEMWRSALGIDIILVNQEWKVYLDSMNNLDFDLAISVWIGDYADPNTFLDMFETGNGNNRTGWSNPEYDRMLRESARTRDPDERFAIFQKMEAVLIEEAPMLPIYFYTNAYLLDPAVKGWNPTILDNHPYKYVYLDAE